MKITDELIETVARETHAHERSVMRRLLGLHVRGHVASVIDEAIKKYRQKDERRARG